MTEKVVRLPAVGECYHWVIASGGRSAGRGLIEFEGGFRCHIHDTQLEDIPMFGHLVLYQGEKVEVVAFYTHDDELQPGKRVPRIYARISRVLGIEEYQAAVFKLERQLYPAERSGEYTIHELRQMYNEAHERFLALHPNRRNWILSEWQALRSRVEVFLGEVWNREQAEFEAEKQKKKNQLAEEKLARDAQIAAQKVAREQEITQNAILEQQRQREFQLQKARDILNRPLVQPNDLNQRLKKLVRLPDEFNPQIHKILEQWLEFCRRELTREKYPRIQKNWEETISLVTRWMEDHPLPES